MKRRSPDGIGNSKGDGGGKSAGLGGWVRYRFDMEVREICLALEKESHLIFGALGVLDLIVEFARPLIPLFSRIPDVLNRPMVADRLLDNAWRFKEPIWQKARDIPVGSVFSCPEIGGDGEAITDCIVVVPASQCVAPRSHYNTHTKWIVGVIIPTVTPTPESLWSEVVKFNFGADRTITSDQLQDCDWNPKKVPDNGLYKYITSTCIVNK